MIKIDSKKIERLYDKIAGKTFKGDYEKYRWSGKVESSRYMMMKDTLKKISKNYKFRRYIELGPGPGTWTKLFIKKNPEAEFTLVDISKEMIKQAKKKLGLKKNIKYIKGDFSKLNLKKGYYDFFFSSRAIEYLPNKEETFRKISELLIKESRGVIITKTPHKTRDKIYELLGRKIRMEHKDQISPGRMKKLLEKNGFKNISMKAVIVEFPPSVRFNLPKVNKIIYKLMGNKKLNFLSQALSEAYLVVFEK